MAQEHAGYLRCAASTMTAILCFSGLLVSSTPAANKNQPLALRNQLTGVHVLNKLPVQYPKIVSVDGARLGWDFAFSGDGRFIACEFSNVVDIRGRTSLKLPLPDKAKYLLEPYQSKSLAISPCGEYLLAGGHLRNVYYWSIKERRFKGGLIATSHEDKSKQSHFADKAVLRLRFARSGRYLVARCGNGSIFVYGWPTLRWIETLQDRGGINCSVDISDDGKYVVTGCAGDPSLLWELHEEDGARPPLKITCPGLHSTFVTITRSGSMVAYAGFDQGWPSVVETCTLQERLRLVPSTRLVGQLHLAFSADGRLLVFSGRGGVSVFDLARKEEVIFLAAEEARADIAPQTEDLLVVADKFYVIPWQLYLRKWSDLQEQPLPADRINRLLASLAGENAKQAFEAMIQLIGQGDMAVKALADQLQPILPINQEVAQDLLRKMASDDPAVRERATREMRSYGLHALQVLKEASRHHPEAEVRRRCETLLRDLDDGGCGQITLWERRALEILESLATPAAVQLLKKLAEGVEVAPLTLEAQLALQRLSWRSVCKQ